MAKNLLPLDELIAGYLREGIQDAGVTYRQIAKATGMSINRIGIILRQEPPPATVGEIGMLASMIGMSASELVDRAEADRHSNVTHVEFGKPESVSGADKDLHMIPENVEDEWAGQYAADGKGDDPIDHSQ